MKKRKKEEKKSKKKRSWLPLESNPEVLSSYARALGAPASTSFADVYGLDDELLGMVPGPVLALLLLFPITKSYEDKRVAQEKELLLLLKRRKEEEEAEEGDDEEEKQQKDKSAAPSPPLLPYFTRQTIGNACGTVGLIHSFASIKNKVSFGGGDEGGRGGGSQQQQQQQQQQGVFEPGSFFERFFEATAAMTPDGRAAFLEADDEEEEEEGGEGGEAGTQKTSTGEEEDEEEDEARKKDRETRAALAASIDAAHAAGEFGSFFFFFFFFETESKSRRKRSKGVEKQLTSFSLSLSLFLTKQNPSLSLPPPKAAVKGDTRPPGEDEAVDLHFVAFVEAGGRLWELDGRKVAPVDHGATSEGTLLKDAARVIGREFVQSETAEGSINFNLLALVGGGGGGEGGGGGKAE